MISDPGYDLNTWCAVYDLRPVKGNWAGYIKLEKDGDGYIVTELIAMYFAKSINEIETVDLTLLDTWIGVDSGQVGIFDQLKFQRTNEFYEKACEVSLAPTFAGIVNKIGINCSSNGDGSYQAYVHYRKTLIDMVRVVFVAPEDLRANIIEQVVEKDDALKDEEEDDPDLLGRDFLPENDEDDGEIFDDEPDEDEPPEEEEPDEDLD